MPDHAFAQKLRSIIAKNEENMRFLRLWIAHFFEVHCSEFKPDPICYLSQASEKSISHRVLFLCICKHSFNCLFPQCVYCFVFRSTPILSDVFLVFLFSAPFITIFIMPHINEKSQAFLLDFFDSLYPRKFRGIFYIFKKKY